MMRPNKTPRTPVEAVATVLDDSAVAAKITVKHRAGAKDYEVVILCLPGFFGPFRYAIPSALSYRQSKAAAYAMFDAADEAVNAYRKQSGGAA